MRIILTGLFISILTLGGMAQCDTIANACLSHISNRYVSDGQLYRALLYDDQVAEFNTTFYGGSTYRLAGCSGFEDGNLIYSVFDEKRNLLFSSSEFGNAPHWDFQVASTMRVIIEARLDLEKLNSGCAVMLIGFKP
jgi:hypothetical protein